MRNAHALPSTLTLLLALGCGGGDGRADASRPDSSAPDASAPDASAPDASAPDASAPDSSVPDASAPDASDDGSMDSSVADASADSSVADASVAGGDTCGAAVDVTAGGSFAAQSTMDATDDYSAPIGSGCPSGGAASGRDVVYSVTPTASTNYRVTVTPTAGSSFDPMLYAVSACDFSSGCIDGTVLNGPGVAESISFTVGAGETVFVVVDGELVSRGDFTLLVVIE